MGHTPSTCPPFQSVHHCEHSRSCRVASQFYLTYLLLAHCGFPRALMGSTAFRVGSPIEPSGSILPLVSTTIPCLVALSLFCCLGAIPLLFFFLLVFAYGSILCVGVIVGALMGNCWCLNLLRLFCLYERAVFNLLHFDEIYKGVCGWNWNPVL